MLRLSAIALSLVIAGAGGALAQTAPLPGMGVTSPLGSMNFNTPSGPAGIPLGATELGNGGTSPLPGVTPCTLGGISGAGTGMGTSTSTGAFDGGGSSGGISGMGTSTSTGAFDGGISSMGTGTTSCATSGIAAAPAMPNTPATGLQGTVGNTTIPLGSVEVPNAGVSPLIGVPAPTIGTTGTIGTPCGSSMTGSTPLSTTPFGC
jgi:hypothetical protein